MWGLTARVPVQVLNTRTLQTNAQVAVPTRLHVLTVLGMQPAAMRPTRSSLVPAVATPASINQAISVSIAPVTVQRAYLEPHAALVTHPSQLFQGFALVP